jgi:hypothetical protein
VRSRLNLGQRTTPHREVDAVRLWNLWITKVVLRCPHCRL